MTVEGVAEDWAPRECVLPTAEQPLRVAEFDELFTASLRAAERQAPTLLRLVLDASAEANARDLAAREAECCSFFTFTFHGGEGDRVAMDVAVPDAYVAVLDGLAARAARRGEAGR